MALYDRKSKTWRASIMVDGRRYQKRGFVSKANALAWKRKIHYEHERNIIDLPTEKRSRVKLSALIEKYLAMSCEFKREKTYARERSSLGVWSEFFRSRGIEYCHDRINVDEFLSWRKNRPTHFHRLPSKRTINLDLEIMTRVFVWGVKRDIIPDSPIKNPQKYRQNRPGLPRYLSLEEIHIIEKAAAQDARKAHLFESISILVRTGLRSGELCKLRPATVDIVRKLIIVPGSIAKNHWEF